MILSRVCNRHCYRPCQLAKYQRQLQSLHRYTKDHRARLDDGRPLHKRTNAGRAAELHGIQSDDEILQSLFTSKETSKEASIAVRSPAVNMIYDTPQGKNNVKRDDEVGSLFSSIASLNHGKRAKEPFRNPGRSNEDFLDTIYEVETFSKANIDQLDRHFEQQLQDVQSTLISGKSSLVDTWTSVARILHIRDQQPTNERFKPASPLVRFLGQVLERVAQELPQDRNGNVITPVHVISHYASCGQLQFQWHRLLWIQLGTLISNKEMHGSRALAQDLKNILQTVDKFIELQSPDIHKNMKAASLKNTGLVLPLFDPKGMPSLTQRVAHIFGMPLEESNDRIAAALLLALHYVKVLPQEYGPATSQLDQSIVQVIQLLAQEPVHWDCTSFEGCLKAISHPPKHSMTEKQAWRRSPVEIIRDADGRHGRHGQQASQAKAGSEASNANILVVRSSKGDSAFTPVSPARSIASDVRRVSSVQGQIAPSPSKALDAGNMSDFYRHTERLKSNKDQKGAIKLWDASRQVLSKTTRLTLDEKSQVYARFMKLFNELKTMQHTTTVWNLMIANKFVPDKRHWNAMITGCSHTRDLESIQSIWQRMLTSGIHPDEELWTTYIHGVIKAGNFNQGLKILEHFSSTWASNSGNSAIPIGPIHGALSAFTDMKGDWGRNAIARMQQRILSWARSRGIKPTTHTYNILLEPIIGHASPDMIAHHISSMSADGCQPDVITWTLMISGLFSPTSTFFTLTPASQTATIQDMLSMMSDNQIYPSAKTYSTLVSGLLDSRHHEPNIECARLVLDHMHEAKVPPSEYIYTVLLSHYFKLTPPDITAANSLLESLLGDSRMRNRLGAIFWNKAIECYANVDEWEKALYYLRNRPLKKEDVGWVALSALMASLRRAGETGLGEEVARKVSTGQLNKGMSGVGGGGHQRYCDEVERLRVTPEPDE